MNRKAAANTNEQNRPESASLATRIMVSAWLVLVIVGFWAPYFSIPFSALSVLTGIYGIFVLVGAASATLALLRRGQGKTSNG